MAVWVMLYVGGALVIWAAKGFGAALIFVGGLAFAVWSLIMADWMTRER